jgi:hypothetical protein
MTHLFVLKKETTQAETDKFIEKLGSFPSLIGNRDSKVDTIVNLETMQSLKMTEEEPDALIWLRLIIIVLGSFSIGLIIGMLI